MNRLRELRHDAQLTLREVSDYVKIAHTGLHNLEKDQRPFRETHIERLTSFFDVTSDYLLGYNEEGIGVYFDSAIDDEDHIYISKDTYAALKQKFDVSESIIVRKATTSLKIELPNGEIINDYSGKYTIYRRIKIEKEAAGIGYGFRAAIDKELDKMDDITLEKVLKFIRDYL